MADGYGVSQRAGSRIALRAGALTVAALLAGCATLVPKAKAPPSPPPPPAAAPGALPSEEQARDRIAVLVPLTGPNAEVGRSIANAANLALLDTRSQLLRITAYDTAPGAALAAQKAIAEGNRLILGPLLSADVRAVAPIAQAAHVPVLTFSNDVDVASGGVYLLGFTPTQSIDRVVDYAVATRGMKRVAALVPNGLYGRRASNALLEAAQQAGGAVVSMQGYDRSAASLAAAIKKLGDPKGYDALLIADSGRIALVAAPLVRRTGSAAKLLGTELWNTEPQLASAANMTGAWFAAVPDRLYRQFAEKYRVRFGKGPYRLASLGYDSVLLAVRLSGDWKPGQDFPERRLGDAGGFAGIDGAFRFENNVATRMLDVKQIGSGGVTIVSPAPASFAKPEDAP